MSVYVDTLIERQPGWWTCDMVADTLDEMRAMAAKIGTDFMVIKDGAPLYRLLPDERERAIALGAIDDHAQAIACSNNVWRKR